MIDARVVELAGRLVSSADRREAAQMMADHLGVSALLFLVEDRGLDALLPAPGAAQTLPGGPLWRAFLRTVRTPGTHRGMVGYPGPADAAPALARTDLGVVVVLVGRAGSDPQDAALAALGPVIPFLSAAFRAEYTAQAARGELTAAQDYARQVESLARALDAARSEAEQMVTELEGKTRALEEAGRRAAEASRVKDEFLAMLGHELRNPLSPIVTALQLMRLKNRSSREQDVIERQVASLTRLVDDLLDVSRITRGRIELKKEFVEVAAVVAAAIEMASPAFEKKGQMLEVRVPPQGLGVDADRTRLAQVVANLLTNASKYSDPDTRIVIQASCVDSRVRISVRDCGVGIAPENLDRVFDVFMQQPQSIERAEGGLGLGLAIVRSLVRLHGGTVRAASDGPGKGSEFVVELPAALPSLASAPASVRDAAPAGRRAERVLIVDDNQDAASLVAEGLASLGYDVRVAYDGSSALRIAVEYRPDAALLDIGLPVMDGYELAERLAALPRQGPLRLIAVTGYGQAEDKKRAAAAGFAAHLVRPVSLEQLQHALDELPSAGRRV